MSSIVLLVKDLGASRSSSYSKHYLGLERLEEGSLKIFLLCC